MIEETDRATKNTMKTLRSERDLPKVIGMVVERVLFINPVTTTYRCVLCLKVFTKSSESKS